MDGLINGKDGYFLRNVILTFLYIDYIWETYLLFRQYKKATNAKDVPVELRKVLTPDVFERSKRYSLAKLQYEVVTKTFGLIQCTLLFWTGILAMAWDYAESINPVPGVGEVTTSCIWLVIVQTVSTIIDLPFNIYYTFVLEEEFGFNKQTAGFYVWDKIKSFLLMQVISAMVASILIIIIKNGGDYFFVWLWAACCILSLVFMTIYPSVIAPLFDKYEPLPEGDLRTEIEKLASDLKFPLTQLYVVEGSKRSAHSNAYFYGFFNSKRIVLFDTLLAKEDGSGCSNEEILAILSHELGHWSYNHVLKNLIIIQLNLFLLFTGFSFMFKYPPIYKSIGFLKIQPCLVGLFVVLQYVMMPYNSLLSFLITCLSRHFEFQADNFAMQLGKAEPLSRSLIQLNKDNLGFPVYDNWYSAYHHSHPPILERMAALKSKKSQ